LGDSINSGKTAPSKILLDMIKCQFLSKRGKKNKQGRRWGADIEITYYT
jgi:hypothetical protein